MLEILSKTDKSFSQLIDGINEYHSVPEIKIPVTDETKFEIVKDVLTYAKIKKYKFLDTDGVRVQFADGWALVRASNTGPNLTVRFEAMTKDRLDEIKSEFEDVIYGTMEKYGVKKEN
jgi:phosphomannomutase